MASLLAKIFGFQANIPVPSLDPLDAEFQQIIDVLNGTATGTKLLVKTSDATDPVIESDQLGAGPLAEWKQNTTLKASINNAGTIVSAVTTGTAPVSAASTTVCPNLNADAVDGIQGANIAKLDTNTVDFAVAGFFIRDPATFPISVQTELPQFLFPPTTGALITKAKGIRAGGTHTPGGFLEFKLLVGGVERATIIFNDTNNAIFTVYEDDISDLAVTENTLATFFLKTRTGTITEQSISLEFCGTRRLT